MTFVELLKYSKTPTILNVGDNYIYWDNKTKEWVVTKRKNKQIKLELFRSQDEHEVANILIAAQK